jgi:hypothetical protein
MTSGSGSVVAHAPGRTVVAARRQSRRGLSFPIVSPVDQGSGELREKGSSEAGLKALLDGIRFRE